MAGARDLHRRVESRYNKMLYIRKLEKAGELTQADYRILARRPEILGRKLALTIFGSVEAWGNDTRKNIALHIMKVFCGPMVFFTTLYNLLSGGLSTPLRQQVVR